MTKTANDNSPKPVYSIKCDVCKRDIGHTDSLSKSVAGGYCNAHRP